ncbi:hypothetical protein AB0P15_30495 [Streptomyces sp. NPDC087917]|uniref:hypothetical protein n=1 Tax=unclassified Streptomyces TaxID=2593676 RepID=UPI0034355C9F
MAAMPRPARPRRAVAGTACVGRAAAKLPPAPEVTSTTTAPARGVPRRWSGPRRPA